MGKLVKLALEGQLDSGYQVELVEIKEDGRDGRTLAEGIVGSLPPASEVYQDYQDWQRNYEYLSPDCLRSLQKRGQGKLQTEVSVDKCQQAAEQLRKSFNKWLNDDGFDKLENILRTKLNEEDDIRLIIKTTDSDLWKFPWSVWDFFEAYPKAEVAFSSSEAKGGEKPIYANPRKKVRILGICGDREGIDYQNDQENLKRLRSVGAEPEIYEEPSLQKVRDFLWEKTWDIFFFAGHSDSNANLETGRLYVNPKESLTPDDLKSSLKTAIEKGLKIAFLNSCDGLGLARQLVTELQIPLAIAMREPVPNAVAQKFLEYFLWEYAYRELPLYLAVRKARQRIAEDWQEKLPSMDWLPVICQNPAIRPPNWQDLHRPVSLREVGIASAVCTSLLMAVRFFGLLQPLELSAFDQFMRMRPPEKPDERIAIITIDEEDIQYQLKNNIKDRGSLSDRALDKLLIKLEPHKPRVIGLDVTHDFTFEDKLNKTLKRFNNFIAVCTVGDTNKKDLTPILPPPGIPRENLGFADITNDPDNIIRRHLIGMSSNDTCPTSLSLSSRVAYHYLDGERTAPKRVRTQKGETKIGPVILKRMRADSGGYQMPEQEAEGYQILLNYRRSPFEKIPLRKILEGAMDDKLADLVKDRIVLIGITQQNQDKHLTPYSTGMWPDRMSGIELHAHMISQIVSTVLDGRHLLWWWPQWAENLWIGCWSVVGGVMVWRWRSPLSQGLAIATAGGTLCGICFVVLLQGGWVPVVPPFFALAIASGSLVVYTALKVGSKQ